MSHSLRATDLISEAIGHAKQAGAAGWPWLLGLIVCGGLYRAAVISGAGEGWLAVGMALATFLVGVRYSLGLFQSMLKQTNGSTVSLAHANVAAGLAQGFIALCLLFFVGLFGLLMLQLSELVDLADAPDADAVAAAQAALYQTPYGTALIAVFAFAGLILAFIALRLLLIGPASVTDGAARVFRTWTLTEGHAWKLGLAALATHLVPFGAALLIMAAAGPLFPETLLGAALFGIVATAALTPFLILGHGLSVAAYNRLAQG